MADLIPAPVPLFPSMSKRSESCDFCKNRPGGLVSHKLKMSSKYKVAAEVTRSWAYLAVVDVVTVEVGVVVGVVVVAVAVIAVIVVVVVMVEQSRSFGVQLPRFQICLCCFLASRLGQII